MTDVSALVTRFQYISTLKTDAIAKQITVLGKIGNDDAIITIEKTPFLAGQGSDIANTLDDIRLIESNDVDFWAHANIAQSLPDVPGSKVNLIYPASSKHIQKYSSQEYCYVLETPETYTKYVEPYVKQNAQVKWVQNILYHGAEAQLLIFHDKDPHQGFALLPDMAWNKLDSSMLHLCCIVMNSDLASIRDLNAFHLQWLKSLRRKLYEITFHSYQLTPDQLRIYFHYQPTYYHLHIHVANVNHDGLGSKISAGKAIFLDTVIDNISLCGDYYQKCNLSYTLGKKHALFQVSGFEQAVKSTLSDQ